MPDLHPMQTWRPEKEKPPLCRTMNRGSIVVFVVNVVLGFLLSNLLSPRRWIGTVKERCLVFKDESRNMYYPEFGYKELGPEFTYDPWWERIDSKRTLYVAPYAQLGNTLQSIASAMTVAHREGMNVKFVFNPEWFGLARWDELFSFPMLNASQTFPDGKRSIYHTASCPSFKAVRQWNSDDVVWHDDSEIGEEVGCVMSCCWRQPSWPKQQLWFYKILRPTETLRRIIEEFKRVQDWNSYQWVGVHVRRTDNIVTMQRLMKFHRIESLRRRLNLTNEDSILPLKNYVDLMDRVKMKWMLQNQQDDMVKPIHFYLASDRDSSKQEIKKLFSDPDSLVTFDWGSIAKDVPERDEKIWSRQFAVVELFLLASCQVIIDTPFSTFSEAAGYIGNSLLLEPDFGYGPE